MLSSESIQRLETQEGGEEWCSELMRATRRQIDRATETGTEGIEREIYTERDSQGDRDRVDCEGDRNRGG